MVEEIARTNRHALHVLSMSLPLPEKEEAYEPGLGVHPSKLL
jgi:hypothetical protein